MKNAVSTFSGISTDNLNEAKEFYENILGLKLASEEMGLQFDLPGGASLFIYEKPDHQAATYTALNFVVSNIDEAVADLKDKGVAFEKYDWGPDSGSTDENDIMRGKAANMGPDIAWFKDPAGNFLAILED